jgi:hypothetical protein
MSERGDTDYAFKMRNGVKQWFLRTFMLDVLKKDVFAGLINIIFKGYKELRESDILLISRRHI